jgi:hypothetical protein
MREAIFSCGVEKSVMKVTESEESERQPKSSLPAVQDDENI